MDGDELRAVLRAFEAAGVDYVLIGATAMGFHGVTRATEDVDVIVRAAAENIDRIRDALRSVGVRVRVATPAALHRLKKGTLRAIDRQDAAALRERFDLPEDA